MKSILKIMGSYCFGFMNVESSCWTVVIQLWKFRASTILPGISMLKFISVYIFEDIPRSSHIWLWQWPQTWLAAVSVSAADRILCHWGPALGKMPQYELRIGQKINTLEIFSGPLHCVIFYFCAQICLRYFTGRRSWVSSVRLANTCSLILRTIFKR